MDLFLFLTKQCNFRCEYCYVPFSNDKMDPKVIDRAIELVRDEDVISLFGGEPLLSAETMKDILRRLDARGVKTTVRLFTNGSLFDDELTMMLAESDREVMVQVSYDGKKQRETAGTGLSVIEDNIAAYVTAFKDRCSKVLHVEGTIAPGAAEGLADGIEFLYGLGVRSFGIVPVVEMPWDEAAVIQYAKEMEQLTDFVIETYRRGDPAFPYPMTVERNTNNDEFGCGAGKHTVTVGTDGTIWKCHRYYAEYEPRGEVKHKVGNIFEVTDVKAFEDSLDIAVYLRDVPKCNACPSKQFCSKCHFANNKLTGDPTTPPENGFCQVPNVHRILNAKMVGTLFIEGNELFLRRLGNILAEALHEEKKKDFTREEVLELSRRIAERAADSPMR